MRRILSNQSQLTTNSAVPQPEVPTDQAPAGTPSTSAASPAGSSQRVMIMINGAKVDITNTGIDPILIEALPDNMLEEVPNQHFREQQPVQEVSC
jgi:E3 ubiquitin-protein ligase HUWE1